MLSLADVACRRGGRLLFAGLTLTLAPGQAALVIGPNGTGKSSLLRLIAGLTAPFAGTVTADGEIALIGEASALDPDRRLDQALLFWARMDAAGDAPGRVIAALAAVDLAALAEVPVRLLSTGQRRRAAMARVLAAKAAIWLLDEPASGLDVASVARLESAIAGHRAAGGIVLMATHQPVALPDAQTIDLADYAVAA